MNKKSLITIGIAVFFGLVAVLMVNSYISNKEKEINKGMLLVPVIAITRDTAAGQKITSDIVAKRSIPEKYVSTNAVDPKDFELIMGQKLLYPMKRGDTLLWTSISSDKEQVNGKGLSHTITKGERALSISVDEVGGVAGLVKPNDHIDILCTVRSDIKQGDSASMSEEATLTLLQNITVLATGSTLAGQKVEKHDRGYNTLTLLVTLEEAELLVFAQKKGRIQTILRNAEDIETRSDIPKVGFSDILKEEYRNSLQEKRNKIEVIKKGKTEKK